MYKERRTFKWCWCFRMSWPSLPITVLLKLKSYHGLSISHSILGRHRQASPHPQFSSADNASYQAGPHGLPAGCGQRLDSSWLLLAQVTWVHVHSRGQLCGSSWVMLVQTSHFSEEGSREEGKGIASKVLVITFFTRIFLLVSHTEEHILY